MCWIMRPARFVRRKRICRGLVNDGDVSGQWWCSWLSVDGERNIQRFADQRQSFSLHPAHMVNVWIYIIHGPWTSTFSPIASLVKLAFMKSAILCIELVRFMRNNFENTFSFPTQYPSKGLKLWFDASQVVKLGQTEIRNQLLHHDQMGIGWRLIASKIGLKTSEIVSQRDTWSEITTSWPIVD